MKEDIDFSKYLIKEDSIKLKNYIINNKKILKLKYNIIEYKLLLNNTIPKINDIVLNKCKEKKIPINQINNNIEAFKINYKKNNYHLYSIENFITNEDFNENIDRCIKNFDSQEYFFIRNYKNFINYFEEREKKLYLDFNDCFYIKKPSILNENIINCIDNKISSYFNELSNLIDANIFAFRNYEHYII